ncbi:pirin family protein [Pseudoalteromonas sp. C2R02]|uniref:pirin family protein n=1 Tax=Pseudoalteromonas sp. C2R02 TaxID=2841565 RepID=UPI001C0A3B45|nr:pirin family protein [Pseudoalteromonas sp. C2R02]MBU2969795.1 pirin family protein [Pseudoalteromonas sp. C2R02]
MDILTFDELPQGGFAGLIERQFVTDRRVFKNQKNKHVFDGIGNFVYLADANFLPKGETGMHGHKEVDVISVMVEGEVSHAGSLEHGKGLVAGSVQVQRAGAQGFKHNEINPNSQPNHMIQLWVMPDELGEPAGYKTYQPADGKVMHIYGGDKNQSDTFYSKTAIDVGQLKEGQSTLKSGPVMAFISKGSGIINGKKIYARTLVKSNEPILFEALEQSQIIFIYLK